MDPMTMMMLAQALGPMLGGGGGGGMPGMAPAKNDFGLGALGGAFGMSLGGALMNKRKARKDKHSMAKRLRLALKGTESIQGKGLAQQEALARGATQSRLKGYDTAKNEANRLGRAERQSVLDRESQLGSQLSQNMASRGLGSTTVGANLSRGLASDTNRSLMDISGRQAGVFGDLALGRGETEAAGQETLANIAAQRANLMSGLHQMGLLGGQQLGQFQAPLSSGPSALQMAMPGMEAAFGQYMGGRQAASQQNQQNAQMQQIMQWLSQIYERDK